MSDDAKRMHLSHSQLNMLSRCGEQYRRRYMLGEKLPPGVSLLVGRAVDESVNRNLETKIRDGSLLPLDAVRDVARDSVVSTWEAEGILLTDEEEAAGAAATKGAAIDKSTKLAELHAVRIAPALSPTAVQFRWEVDVPALDLALTGVMDVREPDAIRDTKTSGKAPGDDAAHLSEQLTMYALAAHVLDGKIPGRLALDFLVATKTKTAATTLNTTRAEADFAPLMRRVERASQIIRAGAFAPANPETDWCCSPKWCGYWHSCPLIRRGASVTVSVPE